MADVDGGHFFLTTLIPVLRDPVARDDGSWTSPGHLLREALATLPTAQQSACCVDAGLESPFSRCTRTHFLRMVVIDQPMYNGRDAGNSLVQSLKNVDLLVHQPVDQLSRPWLMFCADFDAQVDEPDGGLRSWAAGLWQRMQPELRAIFAPCVGFDAVVDDATFCDWLARCRVETTMSFNDYAVPSLRVDGYTMDGLAARLALGTVALTALAAWTLSARSASLWWLLVAAPVAAALSLGWVLWLLWTKGRRPFAAAPDTDLPSVLKALHVQQRFALLAEDLQGADAATVHARFGRFVDDVRPDVVGDSTQPPGVIRSDGISLVKHEVVRAPRVAA